MVDSEKLNANETVWIIVLHWQGSHYTRACLASLRALNYSGVKVLLVDNGSPDNSGPDLARQFPEVELVQTGKNLGYSGGCNAGIDYSLRKGAQWIWLLNNDTKVESGSLSKLMEIAQQVPRAGALGAMVVTGEGFEFAASGAGEIDFKRAKTYLRKTAPAECTYIDCDWLSGSNLLLRAQALKDVGMFDDNYFLYFEDTELCWRMRNGGWQCLFVPSARVEHAGGGSTEGNRSYWRAYYYTRNRLLFFLNYSRGAARLIGLLNISGHLVRHAFVLPLRGEGGKKQLRSELLGLKDYLDKRFGKAACLDWCE